MPLPVHLFISQSCCWADDVIQCERREPARSRGSAPINSLFPGFDFKCLVFKCILLIIFRGIFQWFAFMWMAAVPADEKSTLVQVMAWYRQASSHYMNQCWLKSMTPCVATRPQWVKIRQSVTVGHSLQHDVLNKQTRTSPSKRDSRNRWLLLLVKLSTQIRTVIS